MTLLISLGSQLLDSAFTGKFTCYITIGLHAPHVKDALPAGKNMLSDT